MDITKTKYTDENLKNLPGNELLDIFLNTIGVMPFDCDELKILYAPQYSVAKFRIKLESIIGMFYGKERYRMQLNPPLTRGFSSIGTLKDFYLRYVIKLLGIIKVEVPDALENIQTYFLENTESLFLALDKIENIIRDKCGGIIPDKFPNELNQEIEYTIDAYRGTDHEMDSQIIFFRYVPNAKMNLSRYASSTPDIGKIIFIANLKNLYDSYMTLKTIKNGFDMHRGTQHIIEQKKTDQA